MHFSGKFAVTLVSPGNALLIIKLFCNIFVVVGCDRVLTKMCPFFV